MARFRKHFKLLLFAFLLTLFHAFIPHVHAENEAELFIESESDNDNLFLLLTKAFTFNLGVDHLEDYKNASIHYDFLASYCAVIDVINYTAYNEITLPKYIPNKIPLTSLVWHRAINLTRGSPGIL